MPFLPLLVFVALPLIELALLIKMGQMLGFWRTLLVIVATGLAGAFVLRQQGFQALQRAADAVEAGTPPMRTVLDGALMITAGILLILPGPVTDTFGLLLLVPPVRGLLTRLLLARLSVSGAGDVKIYRWGRRRDRGPAREEPGETVIEGEYERLDERTVEKPAPPRLPPDTDRS